MESYHQFTFTVEDGMEDIGIALLSDLPFDMFGYLENGFTASADGTLNLDELMAQIKESLGEMDYEVSVEQVKSENWNALWESNFSPIQVGTFCGIRAEFHPPFDDGVEHELIITPKMAFGSGHHETTRLVIQLMQEVDFQGKKVFDFGCGTGILAILASKLGASETLAVDIELASYENTLENCATNQVENVIAAHGGISVAAGQQFDVILANINRNIILDNLLKIRQLSEKGTLLICSGFLEKDIVKMQQEAKRFGFVQKRLVQENEWCAVGFCLQ